MVELGKLGSLILFVNSHCALSDTSQSQKPKIKRLQRKLHFQLLQEHLPTGKEGTAEEQLQFLRSVFIGKTILICIDGKSTNNIQHLTNVCL